MFDPIKTKHAQRLMRTFAYGKATRDAHLRVVHPTGNIDCVCEQSVWFFRKSKTKTCNCRRRQRGNPKYGSGICCYSGDVRPAVAERIAGKKICRSFMSVL